MSLTIQATYQNGVLRPATPLPLKDNQTVQVTIRTPQEAGDIARALEAVERGYGLIPWQGDLATLDRLAMDDEFSILEAP